MTIRGVLYIYIPTSIIARSTAISSVSLKTIRTTRFADLKPARRLCVFSIYIIYLHIIIICTYFINIRFLFLLDEKKNKQQNKKRDCSRCTKYATRKKSLIYQPKTTTTTTTSITIYMTYLHNNICCIGFISIRMFSKKTVSYSLIVIIFIIIWFGNIFYSFFVCGGGIIM